MEPVRIGPADETIADLVGEAISSVSVAEDPGSRRHLQPGTFPSSSDLHNEEILDQFEYHFGHVLRRLARTVFGAGRYYYSDVLGCSDGIEAGRILELVRRRAAAHVGDLALVSIHDDHIHIVHDCPYSNRSCRCSWIVNGGFQEYLRRYPTRRNNIASITGASSLV